MIEFVSIGYQPSRRELLEAYVLPRLQNTSP